MNRDEERLLLDAITRRLNAYEDTAKTGERLGDCNICSYVFSGCETCLLKNRETGETCSAQWGDLREICEVSFLYHSRGERKEAAEEAIRLIVRCLETHGYEYRYV